MDTPFLDTNVLLFGGSFAAVAFVIAVTAGVTALDKSPRPALSRALETALLAIAGGLLARGFIFCILLILPDTPAAGVAVGWAFFLWPGAIDTIGSLFDAQLLTSPDRLMWLATGAGAFGGMMDGLWRIHRWKSTGPLAFTLDITWGLAGTTNACLLHLYNFVWADHADEPRSGAHRYRKGFWLKSGFALTQGAVMSNTSSGPGSPLYAHEQVHVWQNRAFGPLFTITYLAWMVFLFVPGILAGLITGAGAGTGIMRFCYFNNPWEVWAYRVGHRHGARARESWGALIWNDGIVLFMSFLFFAVIIGIVLLMLPNM